MGGACNTYGERKGACKILVGKPLGDPGVDGRIIVRWIFKKWVGGGKDWVDLAQGRDR